MVRNLVIRWLLGGLENPAIRDGEIQKLVLENELLKAENLSLSRQLETAIDTIQAFGLHNRAIGAEAKTYTDFLASKDK